MQMKVAGLQLDIVPGNPGANRSKIEEIISASSFDAELVVFPEMFTTGFVSDPSDIAEEMRGESVEWLIETAVRTGKALMGSLAVRGEGPEGETRYYNRLYFVADDGTVLCYDKRHLFRGSGENEVYTPGHSRLVVHYKGFRILPLICYDLRFPVWSRSRNDYDVLVYVADWPGSRLYVWDTLLRARAIENQAYVIGVNRYAVHKDGSGGSLILDFKGRPLAEAGNEPGKLMEAVLDREAQEAFRKKFPAWLDADRFTIGDLCY